MCVIDARNSWSKLIQLPWNLDQWIEVGVVMIFGHRKRIRNFWIKTSLFSNRSCKVLNCLFRSIWYQVLVQGWLLEAHMTYPVVPRFINQYLGLSGGRQLLWSRSCGWQSENGIPEELLIFPNSQSYKAGRPTKRDERAQTNSYWIFIVNWETYHF